MFIQYTEDLPDLLWFHLRRLRFTLDWLRMEQHIFLFIAFSRIFFCIGSKEI